MKKSLLILLFILQSFSSYPVFSDDITAEHVLLAVDAIRAPGDNFAFNLDVEQQDSEDNRAVSFIVNVKDQNKSLVAYTAPASSKGKKILMVGENLWIYIPGTRMPIRISAQQKVSSGVSNADVARVVYNLDYKADKLIKEVIDKQTNYHVSLSAKTEGAAYQRIELWTSSDDYRPLKADFYTKAGQKLKTIFYKDYQSVLGKQRPMLLEVFDDLNKEQKVLMRYSNMQIADTPESYFQKSYLPQLP